MKAKIRGTVVLQKTLECMTRFLVHQGGTRSSKTYSICQSIVIDGLKASGKTYSIARKTFPALRATVMRDFFEVLREMDIYDESLHDMSNHTYALNGNLVEFISIDQPQKKRGAKRNVLWLNESNEFNLEDFTQLNLRTSERVILDFNPSDFHHWIYDVVIPREDCTFVQSTYKDNPFLPASQIAEIERLQYSDETYWRVFGLGERAVFKNTVYTNWQTVSSLPETFDAVIYGLDFGFHNPTALTRIGIKDTMIYWSEMLYKSGMTNADLIEELEMLIPNRKSFIYADAAEPGRIEEIRRSGFNIHAADKSVLDGIDFVKRHRIMVDSTSLNLIKELQMYKWAEDRDGKVLDEIVKVKDHALDAARYAMFTHFKRYGAKIFGTTLPTLKNTARVRKPSTEPRRRSSSEFLSGY
jgi:phage terminase large subunit